jgi:hypothetical protein
MIRARCVVLEKLESRTFLSASTLASDQQNLNEAINQLAADQSASISALAADKASIKNLKSAPDPNLATLLDKFQTDLATKVTTLFNDHANMKAILSSDQALVARDQSQARLDHKNPAQLAIDNAQLATDRSKLAEDRIDTHLTLFSDGLDALNVIIDDRGTIARERKIAHSSPELAEAQQQLVNDTLSFRLKIVMDAEAIATDRNIVNQDKKEPASQSTDLTGSFTGTATVSQGINITLGDYPATFDVTSQTATTLEGTLQIPGLNVDATGTFTGGIDSSGNFSFSQTTDGNITTISGRESFNGKMLEGDGIIFQFAGFQQLAGFELDRPT